MKVFAEQTERRNCIMNPDSSLFLCYVHVSARSGSIVCIPAAAAAADFSLEKVSRAIAAPVTWNCIS